MLEIQVDMIEEASIFAISIQRILPVLSNNLVDGDRGQEVRGKRVAEPGSLRLVMSTNLVLKYFAPVTTNTATVAFFSVTRILYSLTTRPVNFSHGLRKLARAMNALVVTTFSAENWHSTPICGRLARRKGRPFKHKPWQV